MKKKPARRKRNPLTPGYSRTTIRRNIVREIKRGKAQKTAIAASLNSARKSYRAKHPGRKLPAHLRQAPVIRVNPKRRRRNPAASAQAKKYVVYQSRPNAGGATIVCYTQNWKIADELAKLLKTCGAKGADFWVEAA